MKVGGGGCDIDNGEREVFLCVWPLHYGRAQPDIERPMTPAIWERWSARSWTLWSHDPSLAQDRPRFVLFVLSPRGKELIFRKFVLNFVHSASICQKRRKRIQGCCKGRMRLLADGWVYCTQLRDPRDILESTYFTWLQLPGVIIGMTSVVKGLNCGVPDRSLFSVATDGNLVTEKQRSRANRDSTQGNGESRFSSR